MLNNAMDFKILSLPTPSRYMCYCCPVFKLHLGWFLFFLLNLDTITVFQILSVSLGMTKCLLFLCIMDLITGNMFFHMYILSKFLLWEFIHNLFIVYIKCLYFSLILKGWFCWQYNLANHLFSALWKYFPIFFNYSSPSWFLFLVIII